MTPNALVYNPSMHVMGGGERYQFSLADALRPDYDVHVGGISVPARADLARRGFPTDYEMPAFRYPEFPAGSAAYDLVVTVTIYPPTYPSEAAHSALAVQFPFAELLGPRNPRAAFRQRAALRSYDQVIVNSEYTRGWTKRRWGRSGDVLYPSVDLGTNDQAVKENIVLAIGRFIPDKGQAALVEAFKQLPSDLASRWRLMLVGGCYDDAGAEYLRTLQASAVGHRIDFLPNAPQGDVLSLLHRASLFWHASGFGRSANQPHAAEHFGISIVEAMSYGAATLAPADGGPREIIDEGSGLLWTSIEELAHESASLMRDPERRTKMADRGAERAKAFSAARFRDRARELLIRS